MRHVLAICCALILTASLSSVSQAQKIDDSGRCHDASGKYAKMEVCKARAAEPAKCRDVKTKRFAKCGSPGTEAVPVKSEKPTPK